MGVAQPPRGLGVGRRLLTELEALALGSCALAVRIDTNRALVEAISMHRSTGCVEVPAVNDESFCPSLVRHASRASRCREASGRWRRPLV
jgi:hypothetical protein